MTSRLETTSIPEEIRSRPATTRKKSIPPTRRHRPRLAPRATASKDLRPEILSLLDLCLLRASQQPMDPRRFRVVCKSGEITLGSTFETRRKFFFLLLTVRDSFYYLEESDSSRVNVESLQRVKK